MRLSTDLKALFAIVVWGASFIATKIALREIAPITLVWLRFAFGVAVLAVAAGLRHEIRLPAGRDLLALGLLGLQGITFHQWLQATALTTAQAATSGWLVASAPVFIAVFAWMVLHERLSAVQTTGIAMAFVGVALVVSDGDLRLLFSGDPGAHGDLLIIISAANWAVFSVLSRGVLRRLPAAGAMFWVMAAGWLGSLTLLPLGPGLGDVAALSVQGWTAVAFLGVLCSGAAYVFWYDALHRASAARVGSLLYFEPLFAQTTAVLVLGEPLLLSTIGGGGVILAGVWLVSLRGRRRQREEGARRRR
jgi:drug/metabolite transporter (DMT)-like permease